MASSLLTLEQVRSIVETDLSDAALEIIVDAADADILSLYGPHSGPISEIVQGGALRLFPRQTIETLTSVSEWGYGKAESEAVSVGSDAYQVRFEGRGVECLQRYWAYNVKLTYTPVDQRAERRAVLVDMVKVDVVYEGLRSSRTGDSSLQHVDHESERNGILNRLWTAQGPGLLFA